MLHRLPPAEHAPLVLDGVERAVAGTRLLDEAWVVEQIRLRGLRWSTEDRRVLATLWWYSASVWTVTPTLASLVLTDRVLSAEPSDLAVHWLPDSRITGATSTVVLGGTDPVQAAGSSVRSVYDRVIPLLAEIAGMRPRPLWAIAADALAGRLLWLGYATDDIAATQALLEPLSEVIGAPLPRARYTPAREQVGPQVDRCSCCLLYLAPRQSMCSSCPRMRALLR